MYRVEQFKPSSYHCGIEEMDSASQILSKVLLASIRAKALKKGIKSSILLICMERYLLFHLCSEASLGEKKLNHVAKLSGSIGFVTMVAN